MEESVAEEGVDKGGYGRECEIRYKVGKMADNLPLDYSCPHPSLDDSDLHLLRPPSWSMYRVIDVLLLLTTNAETLNARAKAYSVPLYLAPVLLSPPLFSLAARQLREDGTRGKRGETGA